MQIDVASYIAPLLFENDELSLHGLGRFSSVYKAANIDSLQGVIHPPSKTLIFDEQYSEEDRRLAGVIGLKNNLSISAANLLVQDYIQSLKNELDFKKEVEIPEVGKLYIDYEGLLRFSPLQTNFNSASYGLPPLQYYPIVTTNKEEKSEAIKEYLEQKQESFVESVAEPTPSPIPEIPKPVDSPKVEVQEKEPIFVPTPTPLIAEEKSTGSSNWWWYLLALICIGALAWVTYKNYKNRTIQEAPTIVTTETTTQQQTNPPTTIDEGNKSQREDDVVTSKEEAFKDPSKEDQHNEIVSTPTENAKTENATVKTETPSETEKKPKEKSSQKSLETPETGKKCVIIVGSFSNKNNADKLVKSLKNKGYNAFASKANGLHKVAFSFHYQNLSEIDKKLKETRLKIAQGAWVQSK